MYVRVENMKFKPEDMRIGIYLDVHDKAIIAAMGDNQDFFCAYPENVGEGEMIQWLKTNPITISSIDINTPTLLSWPLNLLKRILAFFASRQAKQRVPVTRRGSGYLQ